MNLRNKVQLIGHIGNAPEIRTLDSGKTFARFSMATNETYKDANGNQVTNTDWHNIVAWGKTAELAKNLLDKGKEVLIEGKLSTREYENQEGKKMRTVEVLAQNFLLLGKKN
ncbi:MAG: single-stranded DNA-binding protein [Bacteroidia bacterium]